MELLADKDWVLLIHVPSCAQAGTAKRGHHWVPASGRTLEPQLWPLLLITESAVREHAACAREERQWTWGGSSVGTARQSGMALESQPQEGDFSRFTFPIAKNNGSAIKR